MTTINELISDIANEELPKDLTAYEKIKTPLKSGMKVGWYFKDDKEQWDKFGFDARETTQYSGIVVPVPDLEIRSQFIQPEDCVIVMTSYPVEKEYCESTWFSLRRLIDNPELVEVFEE